MESLLEELAQRWSDIFAALARGDDVPIARRLRTEGMMEAAVLVSAAAREELDAAMDAQYTQVNGRAIGDEFDADWREFFPFPQIPAMGQRAPVFPSTRD